MNNILTFPRRKSAAPPPGTNWHPIAIPVPPWMTDESDVAILEVNFGGHEGFKHGDRLVVNTRFHLSDIESGQLVVLTLPNGVSKVRRAFFEGSRMILRSSDPKHKDIKYEPSQVLISGIVMELNRPIALAS